MTNTVGDRSPVMQKQVDSWTLVRDFSEGGQKAKDHIGRLPGHDDSTYGTFKERAYFLGATERTVEGLCGLIFRKPPAFNYPKAFDEYKRDITRDGRSVTQLAEEIAEEVITSGFCGVLVDHPPQGEGVTKADAETRGLRPYARLYRAESILAMQEATRGADRVLEQVRLHEEFYAPDPEDEFSTIANERVRVLSLDEGGYYFVRVYERVKTQGGAKAASWEMTQEPFYPTQRGKKLTSIPFRAFSRRGHVSTPPKPPLFDMAEANRHHLNDSALLQWGLMWTANPTPCFVNLQLEEGDQVALGASKGLIFGADGAAFFLEFGGAGLGAIRQGMEDKRRDMATLGARMLMEDRKMVESEGTARIHRSGEHSILSSVANNISEGLNVVMLWVSEWAGISGEVELSLNTDFVAEPMDAQSLTAIMAAWQGGGITREDLFLALQRGEVIHQNKTLEEHTEELENETPALPVVGEPPVPDGEE